MTATAIIVAAGIGSRLRSETPKQFLDLAGRAVVEHAVHAFTTAPSVSSIVLVVGADRVDRSREQFLSPGSKICAVVAGGSTRAGSVARGLNAVPSSTSIVAVHDGARPLVSVDEIEGTIAKATETGAACLVAPVTDTIKAVRGNEISATLDREKLKRALTPQAFSLEILLRAFENADLEDDAITDECYLVEQLGHPIFWVEGSMRNIKITHKEDLALAEALLSKQS